MRRGILAIVILCCFQSTLLFAAASENDTIKFTESDGTVKEMIGCFGQPCTIQAGAGGKNLFLLSIKLKSGGLLMYYYNFMGRSGEKTFDLDYGQYSSQDKRDKITTYHFYFTPNESIRLFHANGFKTCTADDLIFMKMIELKGNLLKYQIQLPECAKKN